MSDIAIRVENLGKQYRIGKAQPRYQTLRDSMTGAALAPIRALRSALQRSNGPTADETTFWALKDVSFEVKRGEVVGIIGRNGAGKSTLLKILTRITEPTTGIARLHGRVGSLLEVGTGFHPELTGRENVYLNGAILGMTKAEMERKFDEIVDFAEIEQFIDTPVKHYSSGMYVRLAFAVAAHLDPEILIVDEVLAVGDVAFQKKCLGKIGYIGKQGRIVLLVSHNMNAISQLCNRVLHISDGQLSGDGEPRDVIPTYLCSSTWYSTGGSLENHNGEDRRNAFFKKIDINGTSLPAELVIPTRSKLTVKMYGKANGHPIRGFRSGIHIDAEDGTRVMSFSTAWSMLDTITIQGETSLTCVTDRIPLVPGRYLISIGCSDAYRTIDWLEHVCLLTIVPDKRTARRFIPVYKTHGYYLSESSWELQPLSAIPHQDLVSPSANG